MSIARRSSFRASFVVALTLWLLNAAPLHAQSIVDAYRVEFWPSADNNTVAADGSAVLTNYTLTVYLAGSSTTVATANLGKPTPDSDGYMRVNFSTLLSAPLQIGTIYEAIVTAVGPGGSSDSARSNTFEETTTCSATLSASTQSIGSGSATGSVGVTAGCGWTALSNASWITVTSGASGTGNGTVGFSVAANTLTSTRTGTLTIAGNTFTVNQAALVSACSYTVSPTSLKLGKTATAGTVSVSTTAGCAWTASSSASWITVPASGSGAATIGYSATANTGPVRVATLTIAGLQVSVTQSGTGPKSPSNVHVVR